MCVIVYKPRDVPVDMGVLKECWHKNDDGAGLMFSEDGKLRIAKGFMTWRSFRKYIKRRGIERLTRLPVAFHFRIATHGSRGERNCHPFQINENLAMMHNGVIQKVVKHISDDEDISDSEAFANRYVRSAFSVIGIDSLKGGTPINDLFDEFVGTSRLLFMDNDGEVGIVNERSGSWPKYGLGKDMWFSNMHWKPFTKLATTIHKGAGSIVKHADTPYGKYAGGSWPSLFLIDEEDDDWYCLACQTLFRRGDAKRSYFINGLSEQVVDCPECGHSDTCDVEDLHSNLSDDVMWSCYMCSGEFSTDEMLASGTDRQRCPICYSGHIYEGSERGMVERFGLDYLNTEVIERGDSAWPV
jgi:hypothetical protein